MSRAIVGMPVRLTATGDIGAASQDKALLGFYVASTTAGTIVLRVGGSGGTQVTGTITPAVGWHMLPMSGPGGLHATIGGTLDVTFFVVPGAS